MARQDLQLPDKWKERLREMADKKGASVAQLIRDALYETYFKRNNQSYVVSDFTWYAPDWHVKEGYQTAYANGASVDKNKSRYDLHYMVHNPFDKGKGKNDYDSFLIKIAGTGGWEGYVGDYKEYFATATNPSVGDSSVTHHNFFPYLDSELFNLPTGRYVVGKKGNFAVHWE